VTFYIFWRMCVAAKSEGGRMIEQYPLSDFEGPFEDKKFVFMYLDSLNRNEDVDKVILIDDGNVLILKSPDDKEPEEIVVKRIKI
jgi:hypothetical protein